MRASGWGKKWTYYSNMIPSEIIVGPKNIFSLPGRKRLRNMVVTWELKLYKK